MKDYTRNSGNVMILALLFVFFLTAISTAQFMIVQKNSRQSAFMSNRGQVRSCAETGAYWAMHDLRYDVSGGDEGKLGTTAWTVADDLGYDGVASTGDAGEGDGYPSPGEANVVPVAVGEAADNISMFV